MRAALPDVSALLALVGAPGAREALRVQDSPRGPPGLTIAGFAALTAGLAGFHPSKRWPLPGTQKLRERAKPLSCPVIAIEAMREWGEGGKKGTETRSQV